MQVTHIVPRFWPQFDGLGDYARLLGDQLQQDYGVRSRYVVGDPHWRCGGDQLPGGVSYEVSAVGRQDAAKLQQHIRDASVVILHYVGYGYQSRGVPFWINQAMRRWKESGSQRRLIVVFHELWASGPPWKSECYLGWIQRRLVADLHRLADAALTSGTLGLRRLERIRPGHTTVHPVPSGISMSNAEQRTWHQAGTPVTLALFGLPSQREISARKHLKLVMELRRQGLLASVNVIGKDAHSGDRPSRDIELLGEVLNRSQVRAVPDASSELAGRTLAESDLLLSFYPSRWLGKSGSVMAALANGAVPVLPEGKDLESLEAGREVFVCGRDRASYETLLARIREGGIARMGMAARLWYLTNSDWPVLAAKVMAMLPASPRAEDDGLRCSVADRRAILS